MTAPINRDPFTATSPSSQGLDVSAIAKTAQEQIGTLVSQLQTLTKPSQGPSAPSDLDALAQTVKSLHQLAKHILGKPC